MKINLLTQNSFKIQTARHVFDEYSVEINPIKIDLPEIQADSSLEVAKYMAQSAFKEIQSPLIREDHSFYIDCLGIPGPYISFFDKRLKQSDILKLLEGKNDRSAYFEIATVYMDSDKIIEHVFRVPAEIVKKIRVEKETGWEGIIKLAGEKKVLAERSENNFYDLFGQGYKYISQKLF